MSDPEDPEESSSSSHPGGGRFVTHQVEAEEDESVWGLKERIQLLTGIPMEDQRLLIRGKVREDEKTLKQHGLVGGETLLLSKSLSLALVLHTILIHALLAVTGHVQHRTERFPGEPGDNVEEVEEIEEFEDDDELEEPQDEEVRESTVDLDI